MKHGEHVGAVAGRDFDHRRLSKTGVCRPRQCFVGLDLTLALSTARHAQVQLDNNIINISIICDNT